MFLYFLISACWKRIREYKLATVEFHFYLETVPDCTVKGNFNHPKMSYFVAHEPPAGRTPHKIHLQNPYILVVMNDLLLCSSYNTTLLYIHKSKICVSKNLL